jgi:PDZ domain-containing secreted protein
MRFLTSTESTVDVMTTTSAATGTIETDGAAGLAGAWAKLVAANAEQSAIRAIFFK